MHESDASPLSPNLYWCVALPLSRILKNLRISLRYVSLVAFTAEVVVKVVACGERPSAFATDPEDGAFNLFDLAIVVVSIGFAATGGSGSTVAVGRLLRLVKVYYYYY